MYRPTKEKGIIDQFRTRQTSQETFGDWLEKIASIEMTLTPEARKYLACDNEFSTFRKSITDWEAGEKKAPYNYVKKVLDFPLNEIKGTFFYGIKLDAEEIENTLEWWSKSDNLVEAKWAIKELNEQIAERTGYGLRPEVCTKHPCYILSWSNGSATWFVQYREERGEVTLDANQILAQGYPRELLYRIAGCLDPLPLYSLSFEAKMRGEIEPLEATLAWVLAQKTRIEEEKLREKLK